MRPEKNIASVVRGLSDWRSLWYIEQVVTDVSFANLRHWRCGEISSILWAVEVSIPCHNRSPRLPHLPCLASQKADRNGPLFFYCVFLDKELGWKLENIPKNCREAPGITHADL